MYGLPGSSPTRAQNSSRGRGGQRLQPAVGLDGQPVPHLALFVIDRLQPDDHGRGVRGQADAARGRAKIRVEGGRADGQRGRPIGRLPSGQAGQADEAQTNPGQP